MSCLLLPSSNLSSIFGFSPHLSPSAPPFSSSAPRISEHKHQSSSQQSSSHSLHTDSSVLTKLKSHLPARRPARQPCPKVMLYPLIPFPSLSHPFCAKPCVCTVRSGPASAVGSRPERSKDLWEAEFVKRSKISKLYSETLLFTAVL